MNFRETLELPKILVGLAVRHVATRFESLLPWVGRHAANPSPGNRLTCIRRMGGRLRRRPKAYARMPSSTGRALLGEPLLRFGQFVQPHCIAWAFPPCQVRAWFS